ncbi:hypothetical protein Tco_1096635 [Tanacetum coccineum]
MRYFEAELKDTWRHFIDGSYEESEIKDTDWRIYGAYSSKITAVLAEIKANIENKSKVRTCRIKPQVSSSGEAFQERPSCVPPSDIETYPQEERKAFTTMSGLTLDGSFIPHSNFLVYQDEDLEPEIITEVMEIASSQSTPLPLIPYPSRLQEEIFQALENPTGRADHFIYRIDIVDSLCDIFPIENNSMSGNPTPSSDYVFESPSTSLIPYEDSDSLVEETDTLLSYFNDSSPEYETFSFDIEEKSSGSTTTHSDFSLPE